MATVVDDQAKRKKPRRRLRKYSIFSPRFWHGMVPSTWFPLLVRNRFAISPTRIPMALAISSFSFFNLLMRRLQERSFGEKANRTPIRQAPVFIVGHWRSGTTLLHELLVLDKRHNYPTTYQCFAPHHFLLTERFVTRWLGFVLPSKRPMDDMDTGWSKPQEDEFALCNLGMPSPYLAMAFPNHPRPHAEHLDVEAFPPEIRQRWKETLLWFLRRVTFGDSRRIILKSPPHTARIKTILEVFPEAKFIHIVRNPYDIFPSTVRLWKSLNKTQGLQVSRDPNIEEYVLASLERMYEKFDEQRDLIDPENYYEVRYEDLVRDPLGNVRAIYEHLELGDFEPARAGLEHYLENTRDYRTNRHELAPELRDQITARWSRYIQQYGYDVPGLDETETSDEPITDD